MNIEKIEKNGTICAVVRSDEVVVTDPQSALDLLMTAKYDVGTKNIVIDKRLIKEDLLFDRVYVTELLARDEFAKGAYMLGAEDRETMLR